MSRITKPCFIEVDGPTFCAECCNKARSEGRRLIMVTHIKNGFCTKCAKVKRTVFHFKEEIKVEPVRQIR